MHPHQAPFLVLPCPSGGWRHPDSGSGGTSEGPGLPRAQQRWVGALGEAWHRRTPCGEAAHVLGDPHLLPMSVEPPFPVAG